MSQALPVARIPVADYLDGERTSEIRHEYVDGRVHAMVGVSKTHNRLTKRLSRLVDDRIGGMPCEAFTSDVKVRIKTLETERFYYPDVHIECEPYTADPYYSDHPVLVIEILSKRTERKDRPDKFYAYRKLPSLREYVLVAQDEPRMEVYRRERDWELEVYGAGDRLRLGSIAGELAVDDVYRGIELSTDG
ncbi:Uma2 family endonuclease [uncultured Thiohalocapsa sp.]|uniref:Uma2 family endonuclease n=1 Tax=uncultured Thiohalocapsa sp. TaxID=768990 RepID=UPI0025DBACF4|nr:Uma2 family endonuclease [uncultured Thiohalocapsa sp.]